MKSMTHGGKSYPADQVRSLTKGLSSRKSMARGGKGAGSKNMVKSPAKPIRSK